MRIHFASLVLIAACAAPTKVATPTPPDPSQQVCTADAPQNAQHVDGQTAKMLVAEGAVLIDVRAPDYYAREHIKGAINVPVAQVEGRAAEVIKSIDTPVIVYCRTGKGSAQAAATLKRLGYRYVYDLGSYLNWGEGAPAPT